jgi:hypothetical protein
MAHTFKQIKLRIYRSPKTICEYIDLWVSLVSQRYIALMVFLAVVVEESLSLVLAEAILQLKFSKRIGRGTWPLENACLYL